ncbi:MAG: helix-turn-helix domain-containing protein [Clostridiales bacterium]|nr:helix-turn-helix domain-containing protein [Clostridiales bacterium]
MPYQEIIKQLMIDNELNQQKLADILGVNQTTVSQWLLGKKKPGYDSIMLIYEKFGVMPNTLFGITDEI